MTRDKVGMEELLGGPAARGFAIRMLLLCGLLTAVEGIDIYIVASALPVLSEVYGVGPATFALVFTVQAIGQTIGSYTLAPLADRYGRRPVIVWSVGVFGLFTVACAFVTSVYWLAALRFVALLFIGAAQPNLFAAASEFAPPSRRHRFLLAIGAVHALGAGMAALVTAWLLNISWHAPFLLCGIISMASALLAYFHLPETLSFLIARGQVAEAALRSVLVRIKADPDLASTLISQGMPVQGKAKAGSPVQLFTQGRAVGTILLWICAGCSIPLLSSLGQWLPTFFQTYAGVDLTTAAGMTSASALPAAIWPLFMAMIMDRLGVARGLAVNLVMGAIAMSAFAWVGQIPWLGWVVGLGFGAFVAGSVTGVYALAAQSYAVELRVTGMGWAIGAGRVMATLLPLLGGAAIAKGASTTAIAAGVASPLLIAALAAYLLSLRTRAGSVL